MKENLTLSQTIGLRLKVLRIERTLTTEDVARAVNITRYQVAKLESGATEQPLNLIGRLAMLYGVPLDYIVTGIDPAGTARRL